MKDLFADEPEMYTWHVLETLCNLGATIDHRASATMWLSEDDFELTPLASALSSILKSWGQYRDWMNEAFELGDAIADFEFELFERPQDLGWCVFDLALAYVEKSLLIGLGVNKTKLSTKLMEARDEVLWRLYDICHIRTKHGLSIMDDYFQLLYVPPEELAEQVEPRLATRAESVSKETIMPYLPYGQRLILSRLETNARALCRIEEKLDRLIGES